MPRLFVIHLGGQRGAVCCRELLSFDNHILSKDNNILPKAYIVILNFIEWALHAIKRSQHSICVFLSSLYFYCIEYASLRHLKASRRMNLEV
mmetsp:Transcript_37632/g.55266  ORF Transcript_37632/g.55266 Transcript_37632/m.55266 type:complete len:92 (+) Transcript_37632:100-375(+)